MVYIYQHSTLLGLLRGNWPDVFRSVAQLGVFPVAVAISPCFLRVFRRFGRPRLVLMKNITRTLVAKPCKLPP